MNFDTKENSTFEMTKEELDIFIQHFKNRKLKTLSAIAREFKNAKPNDVVFGIGQIHIDLSESKDFISKLQK